MMQFKNIQAGYEKPVVSGESLLLKPGTVNTIIGPNGCGKSTLLQSLAGILPLLSGTITTGEKEINARSLFQYIAYVDTHFSGAGQMTVQDVLSLGRFKHTNLWHELQPDDKKVIAYWQEQMQVAHLQNVSVAKLSDGQRQMVLITRSLIEETDVIILDEPSAFLDVPNTIQVMKTLKNIAVNQNKSILFSSHDLSTTLQIADQIIGIHESQFFGIQKQQLQEEDQLNKIFNLHKGAIHPKTGVFKL